MVREHYQTRARIKLIVEYRRRFLNTLLTEGDEQAEQVADEYNEARAGTDLNYDQARAAAANKRVLSDEDRIILDDLWRKLVKLFHPDRFATQLDKKPTYEDLRRQSIKRVMMETSNSLRKSPMTLMRLCCAKGGARLICATTSMPKR